MANEYRRRPGTTSRGRMDAPHRVNLFGVHVDALTMDETVARIADLVAEGDPVQHCVINANKVALMADDPVLARIVGSCAVVNADGQAVVWAARLLGRPLPERVTGVDLFLRLVALAEERGYSVYFLGATREVVEEAARRVCRRHPRLDIVGTHGGFFAETEEAALCAEIAGLRPQLLFVGMPSPRKEYWLAANLERLGVTVALGVGGSFDVIAGLTRRAPLWMQRAGLEWFYRFAQEPRRMWRRYLFGNARFVALVACEAFRRRPVGPADNR
jgi:N-acetylglucosaminyldiphosphoundecaprenol N-acetyl-beta-D-mannosaminyltransferase